MKTRILYISALFLLPFLANVQAQTETLTNEEVITDIVRRNVRSYKDLPLNLYHIQWKFRDEIRPRFGVMRGREFLMKDAYSFDISKEAAVESYNLYYRLYLKIFSRMGLSAIPLRAETGAIGGDLSHEFHIIADTGESALYYDAKFDDIRAGKVELPLEEMQRIVETGAAQVVDARPAGRFTGIEPEPRAGMRSGHMPGARNVPAVPLSPGGHFLGDAALNAAFEAAGVDMTKPVVTSCGSGITAAVLILALELLGKQDGRIYYGSWAEWGGRGDTPVVTGEA